MDQFAKLSAQISILTNRLSVLTQGTSKEVDTTGDANFVNGRDFNYWNNHVPNQYHPVLQNYENFSYANTRNVLQPPLAFNVGDQFGVDIEEKKSSLEDILASFIGETRARLNKDEAKIDRIEEQVSQMSSNMNARFKSLENQMGQLATAIGSQHQKGQLPSNMEINPREQRNMVNIVGSCVENQFERVASNDALELCLTNSCTSQGMFIDFDDEDLLDDVFVLDSTEEVPKREAKIE